jgi:hypothetical protein
MAATELDFQHVAAHPASDDMIDSAWDFRRRPPVARGCEPIHARLSSIIRDSRICQWEACKTIEAHEMPNRVTFNPKALLATATFVTALGIASYAETRRWAVASPIAWILHSFISGHFRTKSLASRPD